MTIRFAILAGVSTDAQARDDKLSISDQIEFCRTKIAGVGGLETSGPFVMDGYSRTGYDSLDVAMQEIPPLCDAIEGAQADQYDILIMDNFDRLGDLGLIVKTRFKKYRKQLYSARQSGQLVHPDQYDPYASEDTDIAMYVEGIIQSYRINKIRRGWRIGVPKRAREGLHPLSIPFGYRAASKDEPAVQQPDEIKLIRRMKDWFLSGKTLQEICELSDASGIHPRRASHWKPFVVKKILLNQFYAGTTTFGKYQTLQGKRIPVPPSQWVTGSGKHQPIYDQETYLQILAEVERRDGLRSRAKVYALSGLVVCAVCNTRLHRHGKLKYPVYLDCNHVPSHVQIEYQLALQIIARKVVKELAHYGATDSTDQTLLIETRRRELEEQRTMIQAGYKARIYTQEEAAREIVSVETELAKLADQQARQAQVHAQHQLGHQLSHRDPVELEEWILHDDPTLVNHLLTALCEKILITPAYDLTIVWR